MAEHDTRNTDDSFCARILDWMFDYILMLPLTLSSESQNRWLRIFGLFAFFLWYIPALVFITVPFLVFLFGEMITATWRGDW